VRPALVAALLLAAAPGAAKAYDPFEDDPPGEATEPRVLVTGWAGGFAALPGSEQGGGGLAGGEVTLRLRPLDVGVQAVTTWLDEGAGRVSPILLLRLGQRFESRRGVEATFTLGLGAARRERWEGWFQVGVGARVPLGPLFLAAELAFEQVNLLRLAGGIGAGF
jgi:hypothetical protein